MKFLSEKLTTCSPDEVIWYSEDAGVVSASGLTAAFAGLNHAEWQGKRVAIGNLPVIEYVATLIYLDGLAHCILLLPNEDDEQTRAARLAQANIDIVLEKNGLGLFTLSNRPGTVGVTATPTDRRAALETIWLLPTSGTTGMPKLISHTLASLTRSMMARPVGDAYLWGSLYSLRRFAGLQVFLQSWMCSTPFILTEDEADLSHILARFTDLGCNALSATPSMWRKLAMHPLFGQLTLKQITLGGEIVDQAVLDMLGNRFPLARIIHIYASTEAGVGFVVRDGKAGFPASYRDSPPPGVAMRIDEHDILWLGSDAGWINSGDVVEVRSDRICFLGRANGSINVGGNKVMPEEVESVIKELPGVAFVEVRGRKSTMLGNLVEAVVMPAPDIIFDSAFKKQIIAHCRVHLQAFKVPAFVVAADAIQLTASGKLSRIKAE